MQQFIARTDKMALWKQGRANLEPDKQNFNWTTGPDNSHCRHNLGPDNSGNETSLSPRKVDNSGKETR